MRQANYVLLTLLPALLMGFSPAAAKAANLIDELRACKSENDSLKRLTCFDAIAAQADGVSDGRTGSPPTPEARVKPS
jgi:hypothetical protein